MRPALIEWADARNWQPLQDCFSELVGTGIRVVDREGAALTLVGRPHVFCAHMMKTAVGCTACQDCYLVSSRLMFLPPESAYHDGVIGSSSPTYYDTCPFWVNRIRIPLRDPEGRVMASVLMGPFIIGRRRAYAEYAALRQQVDTDIRSLVEQIEQVRVLSRETITRVAGFLQDLAQHLAGRCLPTGSEEAALPEKKDHQAGRDLPAPVYTMLQALFETAREGVQAERGSLMLFDRDAKSLTIEIAAGLPAEVISRTRIDRGQGLAGWVAQEQKTLFVSRQFTNPRLLPRLQQPQLIASVVMPIQGRGMCLGVLCLSTTRKNHAFSPENIKAIERLTKMIDLTMGSLRRCG